MQIRFELNQRHGRGFQIRVINGPMDKLYDEEPLNMYEAGAYAATLLEMVNKEMGTDSRPEQVWRVDNDALEANAKLGDFAAMRMLQDIKSGQYELSVPGGADVTTMESDGQEEIMLSGRGVVLFCYFTWLDERNEGARGVLRRFCEFIAIHGYKGGAAKALADLDALGKDDGIMWIKRAYARYAQDNNACIQYVMGPLSGR